MNNCCKWSRCELLHKIQTYDFNIQEAALYLDMHPCNQKAMEYYQHYRKLSERAKYDYERCYGPLTNRGNICDRWEYINEPWPWEKEA